MGPSPDLYCVTCDEFYAFHDEHQNCVAKDPMNPNIPEKCSACGKPLLLENLFVEDGCPCNSPRGVNFKTKECTICQGPCSRPGHRLDELFGTHVLPLTKS